MKTIWLVCALLAVVFASGAVAADWTNAGPQGGMVPCIAIDPDDSTTVYAGTAIGVFKSTDRAATWSNSGLNGWKVNSLFIDPRNTSTLYAAADFTPDPDADTITKVFKSTDAGATWNDLVTGATLLAIDPQDTSTLYALAGGYPQGLYKSVDGGANWTRLTAFSAGLFAVGLVIDPQNHNTLYAPVMGDFAAHTVSSVYKSTDGGASWKESVNGLQTTFSLNDVANALPFAGGGLTIDPKIPGTIYATTFAAGVFKSTDGAANWHAANSGMPNNPAAFPTCCLAAVAIDPQNTSTLYALAANDVVYKSVNGGSSWRAVSSGLWQGLIGSYPLTRPLTIDPQDSNTVYAATQIGVFRSTDGAATFNGYSWPRATPISSLVIDPQSTVYAGSIGVSRSTDTGTSWTPANSGMPQGYTVVALAVDPHAPATIYAGTDAYECGTGYAVGIYKSADGGANWTDTRSGIGCGITALAADPQNPGTVYAGNQYHGVYKSTDGGASWNTANAGLPSGFVGPAVNALAVDPQNSGTLYASAAGGLFKSTDGAASWSKTGLTAAATALAIDPQNSSTVYAAAPTGLFQSTDGGATWQNLFASSPIAVYAVTIHPQNSAMIFAGTDTGVVESTDGGATWAPIPGGPAIVRILALDPQDSGTIYAGGPGGLFATSLTPAFSEAAHSRRASN